jgi:hypothetical protein
MGGDLDQDEWPDLRCWRSRLRFPRFRENKSSIIDGVDSRRKGDFEMRESPRYWQLLALTVLNLWPLQLSLGQTANY